MCICLDLDRQMFAFSTPDDIRAVACESGKRLRLPGGGLIVSGTVWDEVTPLENIEALCDALDNECLGILITGPVPARSPPRARHARRRPSGPRVDSHPP